MSCLKRRERVSVGIGSSARSGAISLDNVRNTGDFFFSCTPASTILEEHSLSQSILQPFHGLYKLPKMLSHV